MAYKWILNGCEMTYLSEPKPIHNQSNTKHKIFRKNKIDGIILFPAIGIQFEKLFTCPCF